jgi:hypothetical protein
LCFDLRRFLLVLLIAVAVTAFGVDSVARAASSPLYTTDPAGRLVFPDYGGIVLAVSDLNADSRPDVVLLGADGVRVIPSNGDGTFGAEIDSSVGAGSQYAAVADFNGDGHRDLALTAPPGGTDYSVTVVRGDGTGKFTDPHPLTTNSAPYLPSAADLNGDGRPDLVVSETHGGESDAAVFLNQGSFNFSGPVAYAPSGPTSSSGDTAATGDVNGDGHPDLVVHAYGVLKVLLGKGDGTFADPVSYPLGAKDGKVALGDLNSDGRDDVVASSLSDKSLTYSLSSADGSLGPAQPLTLDVPTGALVADLNGDGKDDIAATTDFGTEPALFLGGGDGTFGPAQQWGSSGEQLAGVDDFNSDGQPDLFTYQPAGFLSVDVYLNQSVPLFATNRSGLVPTAATVGTTASAGSIVVTNRGPGFMRPAVSLSGTDANDFSIATEDCGRTPLVVGASCSASFNFHPSSPGAKTASYSVVPLRGTSTTGTLTGSAVAAAAGVGDSPPVTKPPATRCVVPRLTRMTLARATRELAKAHCRLGRVTRRRGHHLVVIRQSPKAKATRRARTKVSVVLGPRRR